MSNPQGNRLATLGVIAATVGLCILADQLSKSWALQNLVHAHTVAFIPNLLNFTLTSNTGAAFSLGANQGGTMATVATVLTILLTLWVVSRVFSKPAPSTVENIGMGCVLGGACGNLIDRYQLGRVTDFIDFAFIEFPVFNVADALIDVGIGLILIGMLLAMRTPKPDATAEASRTENVLPETADARTSD